MRHTGFISMHRLFLITHLKFAIVVRVKAMNETSKLTICNYSIAFSVMPCSTSNIHLLLLPLFIIMVQSFGIFTGLISNLFLVVASPVFSLSPEDGGRSTL